MNVAEISVTTFEKRLRRVARKERRPLSCLFEITPTCNLRCHFCYVALDPYQGPYLTTQQMYAVLDKLYYAGVLWLTFTGGEIFSRRDFSEVYRYARTKGFLVTLFTNATMMNERLAALFRELPPFLDRRDRKPDILARGDLQEPVARRVRAVLVDEIEWIHPRPEAL